MIRAESLLAAGDTARAVDLLIEVAKDTFTAESFTRAHFGLLWIGRSPAQEKARAAWGRRMRTIRQFDTITAKTLPSGDTAFIQPVWDRRLWDVLAISYLVDAPESWLNNYNVSDTTARRILTMLADPRPADSIGIDRIHNLRAQVAQFGSTAGVEQGAARWLLSQLDLLVLGEGVIREMAPLVRPPQPCAAARVQQPCAVREPPPQDARVPARVAARNADLAARLGFAREQLTLALLDPWPFGEMAAQTLLGLELVYGDGITLLELGSLLAGIPRDRRARARLSAITYEFAGYRDAARRVMQEHAGVFAPLDTIVGALLDRGRLPPNVLWRTGWPFYLEPYNERQVVHRARILAADVLSRFVAVARFSSIHDGFYAWFAPPGGVVRRGLPVAVAKYFPAATFVSGEQRPRFVSYLDMRTLETLLPGEAVEDSAPRLDVALAARDPNRGRSPSGYVAQHFDSLTDLSHQVVRYFRGNRMRVDFHGRMPEPWCATPRPARGFFLLDNRLGLIRQSVDTTPYTTTRLGYTLEPAPGTYVYSIEYRDPTCRQAARARHALQVVGRGAGLELSDVVLADRLALTDIERVTGRQPMTPRAGVTAVAGEPLYFYWEVYGVRSDSLERDRLSIEMEVLDVRSARVAVSRLYEVQTDVDRAKAPVTIRYNLHVPPGTEPLGIGLTVELAGTTQGVFSARLHVTDRKTGSKVTAIKTFYMAPPAL